MRMKEKISNCITRTFFNAVTISILIGGFSCSRDAGTGSNSVSNEVTAVEKTEIKMVGHWLHEGDREKLLHEVNNEFEFLNQDLKISMKFPEDLYDPSD